MRRFHKADTAEDEIAANIQRLLINDASVARAPEFHGLGLRPSLLSLTEVACGSDLNPPLPQADAAFDALRMGGGVLSSLS